MNTSTLTIDQLLRAAQIIEQNVVAADPNKIFVNFGGRFTIFLKFRNRVFMTSDSANESHSIH